MSKRRSKTVTRHVEAPMRIREQIGLDAASEGDPRGVRIFLDFIQRELVLIGAMTPDLPAVVAERVMHVHRTVSDASEFVAGFSAGRSDAQSQESAR